jgi:hypothetical protein
MKGHQSVYFARCLTPWGTPMGAIKVGCSYGHELRLKAISMNQPYSLELLALVPGGMLMETLVHLFLQKHRIAGEYFHENAHVAEYVQAVAERGTAFHYMSVSPCGDRLPDGAFTAFLQYHGITIEQVCEYLGRDPKPYLAKTKGINRKLIAAAVLIARNETGGRYVSWPTDCIHGLLGEVHEDIKLLADLREAA